jgi:hypothetical protein
VTLDEHVKKVQMAGLSVEGEVEGMISVPCTDWLAQKLELAALRQEVEVLREIVSSIKVVVKK